MVLLLVNANSSLDIPNDTGDTAFSLLKHMKQFDWISKRAVDNVLSKAERNGKFRWFNDYRKDEVHNVFYIAYINGHNVRFIKFL